MIALEPILATSEKHPNAIMFEVKPILRSRMEEANIKPKMMLVLEDGFSQVGKYPNCE